MIASMDRSHRRIFLELAWLAYIGFTLAGYSFFGKAVMLPSIFLAAFACYLFSYKTGLLTIALTLPYNMLAMVHSFNSPQGWHAAMEPGGIAAQMLAVLFVAKVQSNHKKSLELTALLQEKTKIRTEELQNIRDYMEDQPAAERTRISAELSMIIDYQLIGLLYHSQTLLNFLAYTETIQAELATKLVEIAEKNIEEVRILTQKLTPKTLLNAGLEQAIQTMCSNLKKTTGTHFSLTLCRRCQEIPDNAALSIYRITYEVVTNALRHGKASLIEIQLEKNRNERMELTIKNNGLPIPKDSPEGTGTRLIRHRAEELNATVSYSQTPDGETIFRCLAHPAE